MLKPFMLASLTAFTLAVSLTSEAQTAKQPTFADDRKALQGVWETAAGEKLQMTVIFMEDKVGYVYDNGKSSGSVALLPTSHKEADGKRYFERSDGASTTRVDYRWDKGSVIVTSQGTDYKLHRINARASSDAAAKALVGTWKVNGGEFGGKKETAAALGLEEIVITEDRFIWKAAGGKEIMNVFYRVDAKAKPATLDIFGMRADVIIPAIFELKGDELRTSQATKGLDNKKNAKRPVSFETNMTDALVVEGKRGK